VALIRLQRRAGDLIDKILRGAKPADLPVEQPTNLVVNVIESRAASAHGGNWHETDSCVPANVFLVEERSYSGHRRKDRFDPARSLTLRWKRGIIAPLHE
jgi:hypothetical protein